MIKTPSPSQTIHDAVRNFDIENLREFIASGKDVNQIDQHRRTPVHIAAWLANYDALLLLIRSKAITNSKAMDGFTALHFACQSNAEVQKILSCIELLVKKDKSLLSQRVTKGNKSALHLAVAKDKVEVVSTLIHLGADLNAKTSGGQLPMALAKSDAMRTVLTAGRQRSSTADDEEESEEGESEEEEDDAQPPDEVRDQGIREEAPTDSNASAVAVGEKRKRDEQEP